MSAVSNVFSWRSKRSSPEPVHCTVEEEPLEDEIQSEEQQLQHEWQRFWLPRTTLQPSSEAPSDAGEPSREQTSRPLREQSLVPTGEDNQILKAILRDHFHAMTVLFLEQDRRFDEKIQQRFQQLHEQQKLLFGTERETEPQRLPTELPQYLMQQLEDQLNECATAETAAVTTAVQHELEKGFLGLANVLQQELNQHLQAIVAAIPSTPQPLVEKTDAQESKIASAMSHVDGGRNEPLDLHEEVSFPGGRQEVSVQDRQDVKLMETRISHRPLPEVVESKMVTAREDKEGDEAHVSRAIAGQVDQARQGSNGTETLTNSKTRLGELIITDHAMRRVAKVASKTADRNSKRQAYDSRRSQVIEEQLSQLSLVEDCFRRCAITFCSGKTWRAAGQPPPSPFLRIVRSRAFNTICGLMILCNTLTVGWETNVAMKLALERKSVPSFFHTVDMFFTIWFMFELWIRMLAYRTSFLFGPEGGWNIIDTLLVVVSVAQNTLTGFSVGFMRVLRVFRMIRVLRVIRVVRFFRELRRMVFALGAAFSSLAWASVLLLIVIYIFTVVIMQAGITHMAELQAGAWKEEEEFADLYGTVISTILTLTAAISGGQDWIALTIPLETISGWYVAAFALYVVFMVFGCLNVLTGVFVAAASEIVDRDLMIQEEMMRRDAFMREMQNLFKTFDRSGNGIITWDDFTNCLHDETVQMYLESQHIASSDAYMLFRLLDQDNTGQIDITKFILGCLRIKGNARGSDVNYMIQEMEHVHGEMAAFMTAVEDKLDIDTEKYVRSGTKSSSSGVHPLSKSSSSGVHRSGEDRNGFSL